MDARRPYPPRVLQGVRVDKSRNNFLLFTMLSSTNPAIDTTARGRLRLAQRGRPSCSAWAGIGQAQLFGTERAMRIWIDPAKLASATGQVTVQYVEPTDTGPVTIAETSAVLR